MISTGPFSSSQTVRLPEGTINGLDSNHSHLWVVVRMAFGVTTFDDGNFFKTPRSPRDMLEIFTKP